MSRGGRAPASPAGLAAAPWSAWAASPAQAFSHQHPRCRVVSTSSKPACKVRSWNRGGGSVHLEACEGAHGRQLCHAPHVAHLHPMVILQALHPSTGATPSLSYTKTIECTQSCLIWLRTFPLRAALPTPSTSRLTTVRARCMRTSAQGEASSWVSGSCLPCTLRSGLQARPRSGVRKPPAAWSAGRPRRRCRCGAGGAASGQFPSCTAAAPGTRSARPR